MTQFTECPKWVPAPVISAAKQLSSEIASKGEDAEHARQILYRLLHDERMKAVWRELYKKERHKHISSSEYRHPACVTNRTDAVLKKALADELRSSGDPTKLAKARILAQEAAVLEKLKDEPSSWNEQDLGIRIFFIKVFRSVLDSTPEKASALGKKCRMLNKTAERLRREGALLQSAGLKHEAEALNDLAADFEDAARALFPWRPGKKIDDPGVFARARGDLRAKAFIAAVLIEMASIFRKELHRTVATVASVALDRADLTVNSVREIGRVRPPQTRGLSRRVSTH